MRRSSPPWSFTRFLICVDVFMRRSRPEGVSCVTEMRDVFVHVAGSDVIPSTSLDMS